MKINICRLDDMQHATVLETLYEMPDDIDELVDEADGDFYFWSED